MGTSLNGLTPATTYTGLLKFGDNSSITTSLKAISDGAGNDTMLELSTTALQVGGSTGMYWDNTNKRLGVGTASPAYQIHSSWSTRFRNLIFGDITSTTINSSVGGTLTIQNGVGISQSALVPTAQLQVKGSGSTSATTSLLVQNSSGAQIIMARDDRYVEVGSMGFLTNSTYTTQPFLVGGIIAPVASAIAEFASTTKGFLPPRMTTTQKNAIASPASGLMVYDTTTNKLCCYNGTTWNDLF